MLQVQLKWGLGIFINLFSLSSLSLCCLLSLSLPSHSPPIGLCHKRGLLWPVLHTSSYNLKPCLISNVKDLISNVKDKFAKPWNSICSALNQVGGKSKGKRGREYVSEWKGKKGREGDDWRKGRRRVGGERHVGEEKRKMPPFQLPYSSNEMLTVEGSNRSKCMKPELVNCSLCGGCAIQHPSPVWAQRARPSYVK